MALFDFGGRVSVSGYEFEKRENLRSREVRRRIFHRLAANVVILLWLASRSTSLVRCSMLRLRGGRKDGRKEGEGRKEVR